VRDADDGYSPLYLDAWSYESNFFLGGDDCGDQ
jgi:hypothetical protein